MNEKKQRDHSHTKRLLSFGHVRLEVWSNAHFALIFIDVAIGADSASLIKWQCSLRLRAGFAVPLHATVALVRA